MNSKYSFDTQSASLVFWDALKGTRGCRNLEDLLSPDCSIGSHRSGYTVCCDRLREVQSQIRKFEEEVGELQIDMKSSKSGSRFRFLISPAESSTSNSTTSSQFRIGITLEWELGVIVSIRIFNDPKSNFLSSKKSNRSESHDEGVNVLMMRAKTSKSHIKWRRCCRSVLAGVVMDDDTESSDRKETYLWVNDSASVSNGMPAETVLWTPPRGGLHERLDHHIQVTPLESECSSVSSNDTSSRSASTVSNSTDTALERDRGVRFDSLVRIILIPSRVEMPFQELFYSEEDIKMFGMDFAKVVRELMSIHDVTLKEAMKIYYTDPIYDIREYNVDSKVSKDCREVDVDPWYPGKFLGIKRNSDSSHNQNSQLEDSWYPGKYWYPGKFLGKESVSPSASGSSASATIKYIIAVNMLGCCNLRSPLKRIISRNVNAFVKISVGNDKKSTEVSNDNPNPMFNANVTYSFEVLSDQVSGGYIEFSVYSKCLDCDLIGTSCVPFVALPKRADCKTPTFIGIPIRSKPQREVPVGKGFRSLDSCKNIGIQDDATNTKSCTGGGPMNQQVRYNIIPSELVRLTRETYGDSTPVLYCYVSKVDVSNS